MKKIGGIRRHTGDLTSQEAKIEGQTDRQQVYLIRLLLLFFSKLGKLAGRNYLGDLMVRRL
jgi:hypothetical protein